MKKTALCTLFVLTGWMGRAQESATRSVEPFPKNNVKINLFALALRSFSFQYERSLSPKTSVALGFRFMPKGSIPFQSTVRNAMETDKGDTTDAGLDFVNNAKVSSWAITPEFRYYFGKKPNNGFYIAPFVRIAGYNIDWYYKYKKSDGTYKPVDLKGRTTAFSGGFLLGAQWHFGSHVSLDWWILGPQYASYNLSLEASGDFTDLTTEDKLSLEETIESIGFSGNKFNATVTNTSVKAENKISLPGLRTGLCLGFTF